MRCAGKLRLAFALLAGAWWLSACAPAPAQSQSQSQSQHQAPSQPRAHTQPQPPIQEAEARVAADLREEVQKIGVTVRNRFGREETGAITVTIFRPPPASAPHPLAIVSHGRSDEQRTLMARPRFEPLARYLVSKGFAVFVPQRVGYGEGWGEFDPEESGPCDGKRWEPAARAASDQVLAVHALAARMDDIDAAHWVAIGQSVGGLTTLAVAARKPAGLVGAVNFSGGSGGNPAQRPGDPCGAWQLGRLWRAQARDSQVPTLWLYWTHDRYWGEQQPRRWAQAWRDGGGRVEFHQLPPWSDAPEDGHLGLARDMDHWAPLLEQYLAERGFTRPGVPPRPAPSGFAQIDETDKVPAAAAVREQLYRRFLEARAPRAFAIGPDGAAGWASGDWAIGRALGNCQWRRGQPCALYAVDRDVVWNSNPQSNPSGR